nr:VOC family protein [Actinoplanes sp. SE50/110]
MPATPTGAAAIPVHTASGPAAGTDSDDPGLDGYPPAAFPVSAYAPTDPEPPVPPAPVSTARAEPTPLTAPPTAPEPDRPFPTAPPPATPRPAAPTPVADEIDIPLDDVPESTPEAAPAVAAGIVAPPADPGDIVTPWTDPGDIATPWADPADIVTSPAAEPPAEQSAAAFPATAEPDDAPSAETTAWPVTADSPTAAAGAEGRKGNPWADFAGRPVPDDRTAEVITAYPSARPGPAGAIHGVGITILVTDLARSIVFYRDTLGFFEIDTGDGSSVLASGDTRVVLRTVPNLSAEAGRLIYLNLEVGDIEAVHDELRAKGVKFVHSPRAVNRGDKLELWSATFRDPDNHNIAITQWRAVRPDPTPEA